MTVWSKIFFRKWAHAIVAAACIVTTGCASVPAGDRQAKVDLAWPSPPSPPRIQWVSEIRNYRDAGISKGIWQRIADFFFGEGPSAIVKPYGVLADKEGRLFVVDVGAALVHVMDMASKKYYVIRGEGDCAFRTPIAIAADDAGCVYITDSSTKKIYRFRLADRSLEVFASFDRGRPTGIGYNRKNRLLYVSDTSSHQVVALDLAGREQQRLGSRGEEPGQFNYPTDLFIDSLGRIVVTDALNFRIQTFTPDGRLANVFGKAGDSSGTFAKPKGVAVDSDGHVYVADALLDAVQIFDGEGSVLLDFGTNGSQEGQFWMPAGLSIDADDRIYVADAYNRRIQVFKYLKAAANRETQDER